jgi:hypothetical protein
MKKKLAVVMAILVMFLGLVGAGAYIGYKTFIKPRVALSSAADMLNDYKNAEFEYKSSMDINMKSLGQTLEMSSTQIGTGKFDLESEEFYMESEMTMKSNGEEVEMPYSYYFDGEEVVMKVDGEKIVSTLDELSPEFEDFVWDEEELTEKSFINSFDLSNYEYENEEVDGEKMYVYDINVAEKELETFLKDIFTSTLQTQDIDLDNLKINGTQYKVWVNADDQVLEREVMSIDSITLSTKTQGQEIEVGLTDFVTEIAYISIDEGVDIDKPE